MCLSTWSNTQTLKYKLVNFRWCLQRLMITTDIYIYHLHIITFFCSKTTSSPVRYFDDVVCKLHHLERQCLPFHTRAWTVDEGLRGGKVHQRKKNISKLYVCWLSIFESPAENLLYFGRWHPRWPPACQHGVRKRCRQHGRSQRNVWTPRWDKIRGYRKHTRLILR